MFYCLKLHRNELNMDKFVLFFHDINVKSTKDGYEDHTFHGEQAWKLLLIKLMKRKIVSFYTNLALFAPVNTLHLLMVIND